MTIAELIAKLTIKPDKKSFDAADKLLSGLKTMLLAVAAVKTGQFFTGMVQDTVELGGHIDDLAQASGQTREDLQELAYAGDQAGMALDETGALVTKLSKNMYDAAHGNKEMAKTFARSGIAIRDANGELRPSADVLEDISDVISEMPDGTEKTALAMELLGKSGSKAIPLLNSNIREMRKEARELGAVMSEDTVKSLDEFGDEQAKVKTLLIGLRNDAVAALLPTLKQMVAGVIAWVKANREVIKQKLQAVIGFLISGMKLLAKGVSIVLKIMEFLGRHIEAVEVAVVSLVAAIGIYKVASIAAAVASGLAWAAANIPLILLAVFIAGLILLVEDVVTAFRGGKSVIAEFFNKKVGSDFVETMTRVAGATKAAFVAVFDYLRAQIDNLIAKGEALGAWLHEMIHGTPEGNVAINEQYRRMTGVDMPGYGGIDSVAEAPDPVRMNPIAGLPAPSVTNGGNTFQAKIEINGANASADGIAQSVTTALENFWSGQMRKASVQSGGAR